MAINDFLKTQSVLALVASDFSYASDIVSKGATLKSFADSVAQDEQAFPTKLLASFPAAERERATSPFHSNFTNTGPNGLGIIEFDNWIVSEKFDDRATGC